MPNALTHQSVAALTIGGWIAQLEAKEGKRTMAPLGGAGLAAICTNLPDILEPAIHPHHRQFFHSLAFVGLLGLGMYKLYEWETKTDQEKLLKFFLLVVCVSYLIHLAMDACTSRSLPVLGNV
jgi:inner membrane protein